MQFDTQILTQSPFAVLTIIAAPAILTNASSIMTLSTSTRLMRCLDRISSLTMRLDAGGLSDDVRKMYVEQVELSHIQSSQFLRALRSVYVTLASFALASFVAVLGTSVATLVPEWFTRTLGMMSLVAGGAGVAGFMIASANLIRASRTTVVIMNKDMEHLRRHHSLIP